MAPVKVKIMGHSFVSRLQHFIRLSHAYNANLNLDNSLCNISYSALPGGTIKKFRDSQMPILMNSHVDVVVIQIGSNDLCKLSLDPRSLSANIINLVRDLHVQSGVTNVVVMQILHRHIPRNPAKSRGLDVVNYNQRVDVLNGLLSESLRDISYALFWKHKGLINFANLEAAMTDDGVHLNQTVGYKKYLHNIRSAVQYSIRHMY